MFEDVGYAVPPPCWDDDTDAPEFDLDALRARDPWAWRHFEHTPEDDLLPVLDPETAAYLAAQPPAETERVYCEADMPLHQRDPDTYTDAEAITRLIQIEKDIAEAHALRAGLVALIAAQRPAAADRPAGHPGAKAPDIATTGAEPGADADAEAGEVVPVVPEVLDVSEWLAHELQLAHPYSLPAAQDLVETSLVLSGRLCATLDLLRRGRIDYRRAQVLTDLLGTCSVEVAHTVEAMVLPKAPGLTPGGLASAVRRALARVDAAALRRRHARARRGADVYYWPTQDGMARLVADLPLPAAAACVDAIRGYARSQHQGGDTSPAGQVRAEVLTDLILRPNDTTRPAVTAEVTVHLTIPTVPSGDLRTGAGAGAVLDEDNAQADLDGHTITAAQCRELLTQLDSTRLFLALHQPDGRLTAVTSPARLRRAARRRRGKEGPGWVDGPGLAAPPPGSGYRPSRELDRHIRTRDRTCRHFGCTGKAIHADLDHHQRWPHGDTSVCNLCCYCRTHHRLKHQAPGWTRQLHPDGTLTITTPTGNTRTTIPGIEWPLTSADLHPATHPGQDAAPTTPKPHPPEDDPPPF